MTDARFQEGRVYSGAMKRGAEPTLKASTLNEGWAILALILAHRGFRNRSWLSFSSVAVTPETVSPGQKLRLGLRPSQTRRSSNCWSSFLENQGGRPIAFTNF